MSNETPVCLPVKAPSQLGAGARSAGDLQSAPNVVEFRARWNDHAAAWRAGAFYKHLPSEAIREFESLAAPYLCKESKVLLSEGESPAMVLFLLEGNVKVTLNSIDGRRLILEIVGPGNVLGLAAVVSGLPYQITAEAQFPCKLTSLPRRVFLDFLVRYPVAGLNVGLQLSQEYTRACEQLSTLGIGMTSGIRLARLLLKWCADGSQTERGMSIKCSLTHAEIGECIGMARETVSRTLSELKLRELVEQRGSTLVISSVRALEIYADRNCA
jgi:CRP/FNR family transcriptional regulator, cyclic AMP receptor protein